jgi:hypothetical protein
MKPRPITAVFALGAVCALAMPSTVNAGRTPAACTPVSNIEAIVDDSGSMSITDPARLRVAALDLLIATPGNEAITFGAVEFGGALFSTVRLNRVTKQPVTEPAADTLFPPEPIGPNAGAMQATLSKQVRADKGNTDYNAAFARAKADNPGANAWIFLTDGGHDVGPYRNGHRGGPPTYVVGFGSATSGADGRLLRQIARETRGKYFRQTDSSHLQAVVNQIGTRLTCQGVPVSFKDKFAEAGQSKVHRVPLAARTRAAQVALSWSSPLDTFSISNIRILRKGRAVAVGASSHAIKLTRRQGTTFLVLKLTSLLRGTLLFDVTATDIGSGARRVSLTTQVSQSR